MKVKKNDEEKMIIGDKKFWNIGWSTPGPQILIDFELGGVFTVLQMCTNDEYRISAKNLQTFHHI